MRRPIPHPAPRRRPAAMARCLGAVAAAWLLAAGAAHGQGQAKVIPERNLPALFTADQMTHDRDLGIVTATGHVEIAQGDRILLADTVSYSERDGRVTASGNVSLMEPTGDVLFADYVELTDQLRNGFIASVRILLSDNARLAADNAERSDGNRLVLSRAVYSPCNLCRDDPARAPLWQVKAVRVIHDQERQRIEYKDAVFELGGFPVAYTPYFSHPDPTVKRQSGFLPPNLTSDPFFGQRVQTPYYWAIAPNKDATITPMWSQAQNPQVALEYRQRMTSGEFRFDGSLTTQNERERLPNESGGGSNVRGHARAAGRFRIDDDWRWGGNLARISDKTYLRRYDIPGDDGNAITNRLFVEHVSDRTYAAADAFYWQTLRADVVQDTLPVAAPLVTLSHFGQPDRFGGRLGVDASLLSLYRNNGSDVRRLSVAGSWQRPFYAPAGDIYTFTAQVRGDGYWINDDASPADLLGANESGLTGRALPVAALDWRYPWVGTVGAMRHVIEPIAMVRLAPYGGNNGRIPNEDSQIVEFDDTNLFSLSRFPGVDRFDGGPNFTYGIKTALHRADGGFSELFAGQSLRLREDDTFPRNSGLADQRSDYVARATLSPGPYLTLTDRIRLDDKRLALRRHEVIGAVGPPAARLTVAYANLDRSQFTDELRDREAVSLGLFLRLSQHFSFNAQHANDLGPGGGSLRNYFDLRYTNECLDILFFVGRDFTQQDDLRPDVSFGVRFRLASF
jgi:LPS-assembly protein